MSILSMKRLPLIFYVLYLVGLSRLAEAQNLTSYAAVFAFGDSILDTGNNNNLNVYSKCNFPPYGKDLSGGNPTGRFSDGKVPSDLIADAFGVKDLLPAYLKPGLSADDLSTGVCFASGGSGLDPLTSSVQGVISVSAQLDLFKEYIAKLKQAVGEDRANAILRSSIYLVSAGNNDVGFTYLSAHLRSSYTLTAYADFLVRSSSDFAKDLHALGARKIAFLSTIPLGCTPSIRGLAGILRPCVDYTNQAAQLFNSKLSSAVGSLNSELTDANLVFVDIYSSLLNIIQNPGNFGFQVSDTGCCTGQFAPPPGLTCRPNELTCPDTSKYVFWDGVHPTESAYRIIASDIVRKIQEHPI